MSRCWTSLGWALLAVAALSSCVPSLRGVAAEEKADCGKHIDCHSCANSTDQWKANCTWVQCTEPSKSYCINRTEEHVNCTLISLPGNCSASPTHETIVTTTVLPTTGNATNTTAHEVTSATNISVATTVPTKTTSPGSTSPVPTSNPSPHKSTFDAASFIGGIVLVLGLQAVIFFLYKFCKSKEQNYHTL